MNSPDSDLTTRVADSLGHRRGQYGRRREYGCIVLHITGSGVLDRYDRGWRPTWAGLTEDSTLLEIAIAIYQGITQAAPHYLVYGGEVVQLCPEGLAAWHVGAAASAQYDAPNWWADARDREGNGVDVQWWMAEWPDLHSPFDIAAGRLWGSERSANRGGCAVELLWPHNQRRDPPSDVTWETAQALIRDIAERRAVQDLVSHSDAHPATRTANGRGWDPPPELFDRVVAKRLLGQPAWCAPPA